MPDERLDQKRIDQMWLESLTTGNAPRYQGPFSFHEFRKVMKWLPKNPRCKICGAPFSGVGGKFVRLALGRERSRLNPSMCNICEKFARQYQGGAELEISMLFADVRGSTTLAEGMAPTEFSRLIDRFYSVATEVLIEHNAWIEKLIGDEVTGLFIPGFAGRQHARVAVHAAQSLLRATGYGGGADPWIRIGIGVHTGLAYVGSVGKQGGIVEVTALGDSVNTAARLASNAGSGEILVSEQTWTGAGLETDDAETRQLQLKGRSEPVKVHVLHLAP